MRALLLTGARPIEGLPNVPPFNTVYPGFSIDGWHGIFAPAATPKAIVDQIATDVRAAVSSPDLSSRFREMGFELVRVPSERIRRDGAPRLRSVGQAYSENNIRAD